MRVRETWLARFLEAIQAERDAARNTLMSYGRDLTDFSDFLERKGHDLATASRDQIEAYLIDQTDRGMAEATRARRLSAIRQLYRFAFLEGWREDDPGALVKGPKRRRSLPGSLS
jgi:integrase/recombinase XerD